jgi:hypothetical protein
MILTYLKNRAMHSMHAKKKPEMIHLRLLTRPAFLCMHLSSAHTTSGLRSCNPVWATLLTLISCHCIALSNPVTGGQGLYFSLCGCGRSVSR